MKRSIKILTLIILTLFSSISVISALETRASWGSNENLFVLSDNYGKVDSAIFLNVKTNFEIKSCENWLKDIQYYFSSRFSLNDIPFHYLLCKDKLYQVAKNGAEAKFNVENSDHSIMIAIIGDTSVVNQDLVEILNKYGISNTNLSTKDLKITLNDLDKSVKFSLIDSVVKYSFVDGLKTQLTGNPQYLVAIEELSGQSNLNSGDTATVTLKLKNTGDIGIYGGSAQIFAITDNPFDKKSQFYLDENTWASFSRANLLAPTEKILPSEEKQITFKIKFAPNISQDFVIGNFYGNKIQSTEFTLTTNQNELKVIKRQIVEVSSTSSTSSQTVTVKQIKITSALGYVNVRTSASTGANILGKVYTGQIYKVLDSNSGWYKIQTGSITGWVSAGYVTLLN